MNADRVEALVAELRTFVAEREWEHFHDPKNLAMALASEVGELLAELRWVPNEGSDAYVRDSRVRARLVEELGDVAIVLLLLCDRVGVDVVEAARSKLGVNRSRYPIERARARPERPEVE